MNSENPSSNSITNAPPMDVQPAVNETQGTPVESAQAAENPSKEIGGNLESGANLETADVNERSTSPNKRELTSAAWAHFKREKINDKWKAICKYCDSKVGGDTKAGTKHLHDHIRTCKLRTVRGPRQSKLRIVEQSSSSIGNRGQSMLVGNFTFDQEFARLELAKAVVLHEYHIGFFCYSYLNSCFRVCF